MATIWQSGSNYAFLRKMHSFCTLFFLHFLMVFIIFAALIHNVNVELTLFSEKADMEIIQTIDIWWNDFKNSK